MFKKKIKTQQALDEYFIYSKNVFKESNYNERKRKINKYIYSYFKDVYIHDINFKTIIEWKNYIESFNFKYNYKSYIYYCLTDFLDFCIKFYDLSKNYAKLEGNFKNNDINEKGNIWTIEEFNKFLSVIKDKKDYTMFKLLYFTGLRKGELLALTWKDINFNDKTLTINKTKTRENNITCPKTKSSNRIIYIPDSLINDLKQIDQEKEFIFNISFTTLKRKKDYYCKIAKVKQIKIHEFRHSHACLLYQNRIDIKDISYRLGHNDINITINTYLSYLPVNEKRVINTLNSIC